MLPGANLTQLWPCAPLSLKAAIEKAFVQTQDECVIHTDCRKAVIQQSLEMG